MQTNQQNITRILRLPEVINRTGQRKTTIYEQIQAGTFPKQIRLGGTSVGWLEHEISLWIEERVKESRLGK